ncbi:MAG: DUF3717 domain-containing protein [Sideroxydans sp.]|nr:DUF3717 domain-containing protein [Sideroxydans sp.]MDD5056667.1 DUF3717 domain-containing protein [Sideroxydans sp.]
MQILTIKGVEEAVNECVRSTPQHGNSLSPDATALAEIYGFMIYSKAVTIDFTSFVEKGIYGEQHLNAIEKYYSLANS